MPIERVSKPFLDISMSFNVNPLNSDIISLKNETAIARSIRNILLTDTNERFFNRSLGSDISQRLFENYDEFVEDIIKSKINEAIELYEPRVRLINTILSFNEMTHELNVTIKYNIIGIEASPQQLSFVLQPTR